jgi:amphi-Trp domain-containing protein
MTDETLYEDRSPRKRRRIATYFQRLADRLGRGEPVAVDDEQSVAVDVPPEPEMAVELEREGGRASLEIELEWDEADGAIDVEAAASKARFEVYEDSAGEHRWRLVHDNGNIIADGGEGYASKRKAEQGLGSVRNNAPGAYVTDRSRDDEAPAEGGSNATFELFEDNEGKWRWRLVHDNGNIIADSGQGYSSKQKARQGLESVRTNVSDASVGASE